MIARFCRGWTAHADANAFEALARGEIIPTCLSRGSPEKVQLLRRAGPLQTEFMTILWFDSADAARNFAGAKYQQAMVPPAARELLRRFDAGSENFDVRKVTLDGRDVPPRALWQHQAPIAAWWRPRSARDGYSRPIARAVAASSLQR